MANKTKSSVIKLLGVTVLRTFDFLVATLTENKAVVDVGNLQFAALLKTNRLIILEEYNRILNERQVHSVKDFYKLETDIQQDENWKGFPIVLFNYLFKENAQRCPETLKVIEQLPACSAAMFSILEPGKHVPPHTGIYKGIYRCLFTLQVQPDSECWIKVNGQKMYFKEGECIVFDETAEHEVMNASAQPRVVLYMDLYRKLPFPLNLMNYILFNMLRKSPFAANIINEYRKLETATVQDFTSQKAILQ